MSQYKAYPAYKDSGVEWIGQVPEHWQVKRLRHVGRYSNSGVDKKSYEDQQTVKLCNYTDVYYNEFINDDMPFMQATASSHEIEQFTLRKGDVIITKDSEDPSDIGIPAFVRHDMTGVVCGYHLTLIRALNDNYGSYIHRSLQSDHTKAHFFSESLGITRYGLNQNTIGNAPVALPPPEEQATIAAALDRENARIDSLIQKKTRFIELLKEKRQALITHAVTKGLDPNVKMKDSGVEWIGQVPEHWQVKRLKHLISQCQNGVWGDDPLEDGSDTLCIRVADFDRDNNVVIYNPSTYRQITKEHQDSRLVSKGDILLEKSGGGAQTLVGANVRYLGEEPAVCSNFVAVIKPSKKAESAWLNYLMASMYALKINLRSIKQSTGIQNLDSEQYLDEGVAAPSLDEQATIAAALDRETARIDSLMDKAKQSITLLKERRAAFITAAVTGQIDLRGK